MTADDKLTETFCDRVREAVEEVYAIQREFGPLPSESTADHLGHAISALELAESECRAQAAALGWPPREP